MDPQQSTEAMEIGETSSSDSESDSEGQQPIANLLQFRSISKASGVVHQFSSDNYLFKRRCLKASGLAYFTCISQGCTVKFTARYHKLAGKLEKDKPPTILSQPDNTVHICKPSPAQSYLREAKDLLKRRSQEEGSLKDIFYEVMEHYKKKLSPAMFRDFSRDMPSDETMIANLYRWRKGLPSADPENELLPRATDPANELATRIGKLQLPHNKPPPIGGLMTSTCKEKRLERLRHQTPYHTEPRTCTRATSRVCNDCGKKYSIYLSRHICK